MKPTFLKGIALGATIGAVCATATVALASTLPFTLGATNHVNAQTKVTNVGSNGTPSAIAGPLMTLENTSTNSGATALRLTTPSGHAPFNTNSSTKVDNLNADRLDGLDSTSLQRRVTGTCSTGAAISAIASTGTVTCQNTSNADTLDGIDSSGFVQGQGHIYKIDATMNTGDSGSLLTIPDFLRIDFFCEGPGQRSQYGFATFSSSVNVFTDNGDSPTPTRLFIAPNNSAGSSFWSTSETDALVFSIAGGGKVATANLDNNPWTSTLLHTSGCTIQGTVVVAG
jgi:hypothetical protein